MSIVDNIDVCLEGITFGGNVSESSIIVIDGDIVKTIKVMGESRINGNIWYIKNPDIGNTINLNSNSECSCSQVNSSDFKSLLPEVIITSIVFDSVRKLRNIRKWRTKNKNILGSLVRACESIDNIFVTCPEVLTGEPLGSSCLILIVLKVDESQQESE